MADQKPIPVNPVTHVVDAAIDGVFAVAVKMADAAIFEAVPILAAPVLNRIVSGVVQYVAKIVYQQLALFVGFEIISVQTGAEVSAQAKALAALKAAQAKGDKNAVLVALNDFAKATGALTKFDGVATP